MKKNILLNQFGMSILEILIALGLAGGLTVVVMKNMDMMNKSSKTQSLKTEIENLKRTIQDFVGRGEPCVASFGGHFRGQPVTNLKNRENTTQYFAEVTKEFQKTGIIIDKMQLLSLGDEIKKTKDYGGLSKQGTVGIGLTYLRVWISKKKSSNGKQEFFGAANTFFDVPIVGLFDGDDIQGGPGTTQLEARDSYSAKFLVEAAAQKAKVDTELNAAKAADPANAAIYDKAMLDIVLQAEEGLDGQTAATKHFLCAGGSGGVSEPDQPSDPHCAVDPNDTNKTGPYDSIPLLSQYTFTWKVVHPLYPISDCGNHLSTGVN